LNHLISRPNVLIEIQPVTILDLHDTCRVLNAYNLHDIVLGDGAKSLSLIRGTHNESVIFHGFSFGTYMEHETLKCFGRCIVHKRDKFKDFVHGLKMSLFAHNFHWVHLAMKFVLKCPTSKREKHFHLILYDSFLVLVFDPGGWIGKHINTKRFAFFKKFKSP